MSEQENQQANQAEGGKTLSLAAILRQLPAEVGNAVLWEASTKAQKAGSAITGDRDRAINQITTNQHKESVKLAEDLIGNEPAQLALLERYKQSSEYLAMQRMRGAPGSR